MDTRLAQEVRDVHLKNAKLQAQIKRVRTMNIKLKALLKLLYQQPCRCDGDVRCHKCVVFAELPRDQHVTITEGIEANLMSHMVSERYGLNKRRKR